MTAIHPPIAIVGFLGVEYFGRAAGAALRSADVLMGIPRLLDALPPDVGGKRIELAGPLAETLELAAERRSQGERVCLLASGDPGFFGIVRVASARFGADGVEIHPAPSSPAVAFARAGLHWDDAVIVSAHGRPLAAAVDAALPHPKVAVLTAPDQPPAALGRALLDAGCGPRRVTVCIRLGHDDEAVTRTDLAGLAAGTFPPLAVVILEAPAPLGEHGAAPAGGGPTLAWGRPDDLYSHRAGMVTKAEVRAVALGKLALPAAGVLWDVGAGSGSVAIECSRLSPGLRVFAVERRADDVERIRRNARGTGVVVVEGEAPEALAGLPDPDRVFVGGGGLNVLQSVVDRLRPGGLVVATYAALDRAAVAAGRLGQVVQVAVSRGVPLGGSGALRLAAENPVFVCWGPDPRPAGSAIMTADGGRILTCTVTAAGTDIAGRLPYEHRHGDLVDTVRAGWADVDGFVLVCATGIAVRAIAPLLADKARDPAVVVVDDGGRYAIALTGGHRGGANVLAREVAALLGAEAVVTTATDGAGLPALDALSGFTATGDLAGVTRAWLDGSPPTVDCDPALAAWPLPAELRPARAKVSTGLSHPARPDDATESPGDSGPRRTTVIVTDREVEPGAGEVVLRPKSLVLGVGSSRGAHPEALHRLVVETLAEAGLSLDAVACVASVEQKAGEPAVVELAAALGVGLRVFPAEHLAGLPVPNPSPVVDAAVGTPSVAEAAALAAAGAAPPAILRNPCGESRGEAAAESTAAVRTGAAGPMLIVEKRRSTDATVAVARRAGPEGHLAVVGLGPGDPALRTPAASAAIRRADVVIGYGPYVDLAGDLLQARQEVLRSPIGAETERCTEALQRAAAGARVALVCSGDPGVYAMASLVCELAPDHADPPVTVVPGVTAALAAAAVLGAPLGHDHASISLSDLLTPWPVIERRLRAVADGDFTVSLYNPRSKRRTHQLDAALGILAAGRPGGTPAAILTDVGRPAQRVIRTTLADLDPEQVDMLSLVIIGSSTTRWTGDRMVTPRGYLLSGGHPRTPRLAAGGPP